MFNVRKLYCSVVITFSVIGFSTAAFAVQNDNVAIPFKDVGGALNILLGAYNGAAKAIAENEGGEAQTIERSDLKPLEDTLQRYQNELQLIIGDDGEINSQQLGRFLNQMQDEHQGNITYDFTQAIHALAALNEARKSGGDVDQSILQSSIAALINAAKDKELNQELNQAVPYLTTILELSSAIEKQATSEKGKAVTRRDGHVNPSDTLKEFAKRAQAQSSLVNEAHDMADKLKILYAEQSLSSTLRAEAVAQAKQQLEHLYLQVKQAGGSSLTVEDYDEIIRLLAALGAPFTAQYQQWQSLRQVSEPLPNQFDAATQQLLDELNYQQLPVKVQKALLQRLNISKSQP